MKSIHLRLAALVLVSVLGAATAEAQGRHDRYGYHPPAVSKVDVRQNGRGNGAAIAQNGGPNAAGISQDGVANTGRISQDGAGNDATIRQLGRGNDASITQTGANNVACVVQVGKNLSTNVVQDGGQNRGVVQTKKGSFDIPARLCAVNPAGKGYWQRIGVKGY